MGWAIHVKSVGGPARSTACKLTTAMLELNTMQKIHCAATIGFAVLSLGNRRSLESNFSSARLFACCAIYHFTALPRFTTTALPRHHNHHTCFPAPGNLNVPRMAIPYKRCFVNSSLAFSLVSLTGVRRSKL